MFLKACKRLQALAKCFFSGSSAHEVQSKPFTTPLHYTFAKRKSQNLSVLKSPQRDSLRKRGLTVLPRTAAGSTVVGPTVPLIAFGGPGPPCHPEVGPAHCGSWNVIDGINMNQSNVGKLQLRLNILNHQNTQMLWCQPLPFPAFLPQVLSC